MQFLYDSKDHIITHVHHSYDSESQVMHRCLFTNVSLSFIAFLKQKNVIIIHIGSSEVEAQTYPTNLLLSQLLGLGRLPVIHGLSTISLNIKWIPQYSSELL